MPSNRSVSFRTFLIVCGACIVAEVILHAVNGWLSMDMWSAGSKLAGIAVVMVPIVTFLWMEFGDSSEGSTYQQRVAKAVEADPQLKDLKERAVPTRGSTMKWALGGAIPASLLAFAIASDSHVGRWGVVAMLLLPFIGGIVGFWLSPAMRAERELRDRVGSLATTQEARQKETMEERYQRERVADNWQGAQTEWRQRMYDALVWWSSEGAKLTTDSAFILALVHKEGGRGPDQGKIMARYQNPDDPCSTRQRAEQVATWAINNLPDLIAEHIADVSQRTTQGITTILRHHHKREVTIHQEARAYTLNAALEAHRDESPEHLVERLLKECDAVALAREKGMKRIHDVAATMKPEARNQYIRVATAGVNALLDAWLFERANKAR